MSTAPVPSWDDDKMALADAVGVTPHTQIRTSYSDAEFAHVMANFTRLEALANEPIPFTLSSDTTEAWGALDHGPCEGEGCKQTVCACVTGLCPGAAEQSCTHHMLLCGECRDECIDCRLDAQSDGPGWAL